MAYMQSDSLFVPKVSSQTMLTGYIPERWYHKIHFKTALTVVLPCLAILGACGTMILGFSNGTFAHIDKLKAQEVPLFPSTEDPMVLSYTGVRVFDNQLVNLVAFFAPVVTTSNPALYLFSIFGFGQFGAAWTIMVLESLRLGNKNLLVSFVGTVGLICQTISFTITAPLWLLLHLYTSPVPKPFPGSHANKVLLIPNSDLRILPFSITIGYMLPSMLMMLSAPEIVSTRTHQNWIAVWQAFPLWTVTVQATIRLSCNFISRRLAERNKNMALKPLATSYLGHVKYVYLFVLFLCIFTHIPVLIIALTPTSIIPSWLPTIATLATETLSAVYIPYMPYLSSPSLPTFDTGVKYFLQWDVYIASTAMILWATFLYRNATAEKTLVDPNTSLPRYSAKQLLDGEARAIDEKLWKVIVWKVLGWTFVAGPMGAMTVLLWERDDIVRQKMKQGI